MASAQLTTHHFQRCDKIIRRSTSNPDSDTLEPRRNRCDGCFRPLSLCYCESIPAIDNRTDVLIVQHVRERDHPFNTARMVRRALAKSELVFGTKKTLATKPINIQPGAGLLFPSADSIELKTLAPEDRPSQLVVIDGTWAQAKSIVNGLPHLKSLPCYKLAPTEPGQYRIRLEPTDTSLSTVEAVVAALKSLEPETENLDQLLVAFEVMVQKQLDHPEVTTNHYSGGPINGYTFNVPRGLIGDPNQIVVAYGEASYRDVTKRDVTKGQPNDSQNANPRTPVFWCAENLGTGERFSTAINSGSPLSETFLEHLELSESCFKNAINLETFQEQWNRFCESAGVKTLVAYNQGTLRLLDVAFGWGRGEATSQLAEQSFPLPVSKLTLKSINFSEVAGEVSSGGKGRSLPNLISKLKLESRKSDPALGRAGTRLNGTIALVEYLRSMANKLY